MLTIPVYNSQGKELESKSLPKKLFELKVTPSLLHLVTTVFLGNQRKGTAKVKTRAERRGGGRKPYRQKGTGNARAGTTRSPIWRKGGRVFGPTGEQNYHRDLPQKVRVKSLLMGLSAKAQAKKIIGLNELKITEVSTKNFAAMIKKLPVDRKILLVTAEKDQNVALSARNLTNITTRTYDNINTLDVVSHDYIVLVSAAIDLLEKKYDEYTFKNVLSDEELTKVLEKNEQKSEEHAKKTVAKAAKVASEKTAKKTATKAKPAAKKATKTKAAAKSSKA